MTEGTSFPPGTFCWVELGTTDPTRALDFYATLFGWSTSEVDMGRLGKYIQLQLDSKWIAGMYLLTEDQKRQGVPPNWLSYVLVEDADATANRATELDGNVMMGPFDVPNIGRMAIVRDPIGAVFALFQPGEHPGAAPLDNRPGTFCWNELSTKDPDSAKEFYTGLFDWGATDTDGPAGPYTSYQNRGRLAGGMVRTPEELNDASPRWLVYFATNDCDRTADTAEMNGGTVVVPPTDIPDIGRFSVMNDPQGASFAVIQLDSPEPS